MPQKAEITPQMNIKIAEHLNRHLHIARRSAIGDCLCRGPINYKPSLAEIGKHFYRPLSNRKSIPYNGSKGIEARGVYAIFISALKINNNRSSNVCGDFNKIRNLWKLPFG